MKSKKEECIPILQDEINRVIDILPADVKQNDTLFLYLKMLINTLGKAIGSEKSSKEAATWTSSTLVLPSLASKEKELAEKIKIMRDFEQDRKLTKEIDDLQAKINDLKKQKSELELRLFVENPERTFTNPKDISSDNFTEARDLRWCEPPPSIKINVALDGYSVPKNKQKPSCGGVVGGLGRPNQENEKPNKLDPVAALIRGGFTKEEAEKRVAEGKLGVEKRVEESKLATERRRVVQELLGQERGEEVIKIIERKDDSIKYNHLNFEAKEDVKDSKEDVKVWPKFKRREILRSDNKHRHVKTLEEAEEKYKNAVKKFEQTFGSLNYKEQVRRHPNDRNRTISSIGSMGKRGNMFLGNIFSVPEFEEITETEIMASFMIPDSIVPPSKKLIDQYIFSPTRKNTDKTSAPISDPKPINVEKKEPKTVLNTVKSFVKTKIVQTLIKVNNLLS